MVVPVRVDVSHADSDFIYPPMAMECMGLWTLEVLKKYTIEYLKDFPLACYYGCELVSLVKLVDAC
jgi:hypothetical protein